MLLWTFQKLEILLKSHPSMSHSFVYYLDSTRMMADGHVHAEYTGTGYSEGGAGSPGESRSRACRECWRWGEHRRWQRQQCRSQLNRRVQQVKMLAQGEAQFSRQSTNFSSHFCHWACYCAQLCFQLTPPLMTTVLCGRILFVFSLFGI